MSDDLSSGLLAGRWTLDAAHSTVRFARKGLWGLITVTGTFGEIAGHADVLADGTARGTLTVGAGSLDTGNARRDRHLRSDDFFGVAVHPKILFAAERIAPEGDAGQVRVSGELTVTGVTRPLTFTARATEAAPDGVTLTAEPEIDPAAHGMTWNLARMMRGPARLALTLRFVHTPAAASGTAGAADTTKASDA
ncbi:YceI family protein [Streptomyces sp. XC 2026]|uniref:YceI family protein n=1 Tax=Streptomyces sp. XC 2026 TaxID=2782004 RepID=UPI00190854B1|nr:YceI family protein [Streptomyces sp. XC 2026]QQN77911.1 YceI family protein [Streptomyces sp. XC 2026]